MVCVRNDGMVVTKLAGTNGPGYIGYFHPSSIGPAPSPGLAAADSCPFSAPSSSSAPFAGVGGGEQLAGYGIGNVGGGGGGARSGSAPSFLPSAATVPPVGMFQPVSPLRATVAAESSLPPPPQQQQQQQQQQTFQFQQQQPPQPQPEQQHQGFHFQQHQQKQHFRTPDRSCATPPPSKRRRSAGGGFFVHVHH